MRAAGYSGDGGPASSASLNCPLGMAVDCSGNLYIADSANDVIRKVAAGRSGIITTGGRHGRRGLLRRSFMARLLPAPMYTRQYAHSRDKY